jgi:hypothetical protein
MQGQIIGNTWKDQNKKQNIQKKIIKAKSWKFATN